MLDLLDMRIISLLHETPDITQSKLAEELGISQPWVATRIRHLRQRGILNVSVGIDIQRLNLVSGVVGLTSKNPHRVLRKYRSCPSFLMGLVFAGERNVSLTFCSEDIASLEGLVDHCIRNDPDVSNVAFSLISYSVGVTSVCPRLVFDRKKETPCGTSCGDCDQYEGANCLGCPATIYYRGKFWNGNKQNHTIEAPPVQ